MRSSWKALIVAAAVLLSTVGVMSLAAAQSQDTTLTLTGKVIQSTELDLGKKGFSQGDQTILAYQLFMNGKMVGLLGAACTVVHAAGPTPGPESHTQCMATFDLPKGQVTAQAMFPFTILQRAPFAITGGTGAYRDAGGQGTVTDISPTAQRFVLHIDNLK